MLHCLHCERRKREGRLAIVLPLHQPGLFLLPTLFYFYLCCILWSYCILNTYQSCKLCRLAIQNFSQNLKSDSKYRVSQEECARLREGVLYVKVHRYNPKHICPKLNGCGDNGQRKVWSSGGSTHCTCQLTSLISVRP
jgi:hypothetical protein